MAEHPVEPVEVALVLHQAGTRQVVEVLDALVGEVALERLEQGEVLPQRDRDPGGPQLGEEGEEHRVDVPPALTPRAPGRGRR